MKGKKATITAPVVGKVVWPDDNLEVGGFRRVQDPAQNRWVRSLVTDPQPASVCCGGRHLGTVVTSEYLHGAEDLRFLVAAVAAPPKGERLVDKIWISQKHAHDQEMSQGFRTREGFRALDPV